MESSNFIDYVKINFRSGKGGKGVVHFRRDKFNSKGGPDGGKGGTGGHIILKGNKQLWTLLHLKFRKHIVAGDGEPGGGSNRTGADGEDVVIEVPLGTIARDFITKKIDFEIVKDGQMKILFNGGRGGFGNVHFKSAANRAPRKAQPGESGEEKWEILELKLLADVGLVGFPNAGKSTFLSKVTSAKPKIADYPFTTLVPNLGIVSYGDIKSFVIADIPGIVEGAHKDKGLGLRFLRHIERNALLLIMVPADSDDIYKKYEILLKELKLYSPEIINKKRILVITKADLIDDELKKDIINIMPAGLINAKKIKIENDRISYVFISSLTGEGIDKLKGLIWSGLDNEL